MAASKHHRTYRGLAIALGLGTAVFGLGQGVAAAAPAQVSPTVGSRHRHRVRGKPGLPAAGPGAGRRVPRRVSVPPIPW